MCRKLHLSAAKTVAPAVLQKLRENPLNSTKLHSGSCKTCPLPIEIVGMSYAARRFAQIKSIDAALFNENPYFCTHKTLFDMNNLRRIFSVACLAAIAVGAAAGVVSIKNQRDFNSLANSITNLASQGDTDIRVEFAPGIYFFRENHINLQNKQWANISISFAGHGAVIAAQGSDYIAGQESDDYFDATYGYVSLPDGIADTRGCDVANWGRLYQAQELVEVVDEDAKLCRLRYKGIADLKADQCSEVRIHITQWFKSGIYKVQEIRKGWIYFIVNDLTYNSARQCHSINLDYGYGKQNPRFRLCNIAMGNENLLRLTPQGFQLPQGVSKIHECTANTFIYIANTTLKGLSIEQLRFLGNRDGQKYLIDIRNCNTQGISLKENSFEGIRSNIIGVTSSSNIEVSHCQFDHCYRNGITTQDNTNISITHNSFTNQGLAIQNTFSVRCSDQNYLVSHNTFTDYGYSAIAVGKWWAAQKKHGSSGIVELNQLRYTDAYMASIRQHSLMDSGAIYLYTQNDDADVRYNLIYNYSGAYNNRGIFCDDGASNFKIHGNVIVHTPNSYSIDSRRTIGIERDPKTYAKIVNANNQIFDNLIDGSIKFEGRTNDYPSTLGTNYYLLLPTSLRQGNTRPGQDNTISNVGGAKRFVNAPCTALTDHGVVLTAPTLQTLSKQPWFAHVSQWLSK